MEKLKELWRQYREQMSYLIFGVLTTAVNIVTYTALSWMDLSTAVANGIALVVSILFAYVTNRLWVFESKAQGLGVLKEFFVFIACRALTGLVDQGIMIFGVDVLGPRVVPENLLKLWGSGVKIVAQFIIIVLNYILSKLVIFRKK